MISIIHVYGAVFECYMYFQFTDVTLHSVSVFSTDFAGTAYTFIFIPRGFPICIFIIQKKTIRLYKQLLASHLLF